MPCSNREFQTRYSTTSKTRYLWLVDLIHHRISNLPQSRRNTWEDVYKNYTRLIQGASIVQYRFEAVLIPLPGNRDRVCYEYLFLKRPNSCRLSPNAYNEHIVMIDEYNYLILRSLQTTDIWQHRTVTEGFRPWNIVSRDISKMAELPASPSKDIIAPSM